MGADPRQTTQRTSSAANALTSELPRYRHAFGPGQRECGIDVSMLPKSRVLNTLRDAHPHVARGTGHTVTHCNEESRKANENNAIRLAVR